MNWEHFKAFVWLRWRLLYNQNRRAGVVNAVLTVIVVVGALLTAIPLFIGCLVLGIYAIPKAQPAHLMYVADGVVVAFLFFWMIGLITELQRTDPLSLSKFMHLPVSATGAFLINYLSSLLRLSLIIFLPVMLAFGAGARGRKGRLDAPGRAARGVFLVDDHGAHVSVSGLAGDAHEQPTAAPDGDHDHDSGVRADCAIAQLDELSRAVAAGSADGSGKECGPGI